MLVSGNPVALRQPLYTAFFAERPEAPVTTAVRLVPRVDDADDRGGLRLPRLAEAPARLAKVAPPAPPQFAQAQRALATRSAGAVPEPAPARTCWPPSPRGRGRRGVDELLYRFPAKISLPTGHTMMVPFVDRDVAAPRSGCPARDVGAPPLAAVRVRNEGGTSLPPGIVTAFEIRSKGRSISSATRNCRCCREARSNSSPSVDGKTDIRREDRGVRRTTLGKAVNGELTLTTRSRRMIAYEVTPPPDEDREIFVEEARGDGWTPAAESKDIEETPTRFRYRSPRLKA